MMVRNGVLYFSAAQNADVGRATIVQAEVGGSARMPIIHFRVIERQNNRK